MASSIAPASARARSATTIMCLANRLGTLKVSGNWCSIRSRASKSARITTCVSSSWRATSRPWYRHSARPADAVRRTPASASARRATSSICTGAGFPERDLWVSMVEQSGVGRCDQGSGRRGHERSHAGGSTAPGGCAGGPRAERNRGSLRGAGAVHQRLRQQRLTHGSLERGTPRTSCAARPPQRAHAQAQPDSGSPRLPRGRAPHEGAADTAAKPGGRPDSATGSDSSAAAAYRGILIDAERRRWRPGRIRA